MSGQQKTMAIVPASLQASEPKSEADLTLMAEVLAQASKQSEAAHEGVLSMKMYDRAASLYNQRIVVAFAHPTAAPPGGLSYIKTTGQEDQDGRAALHL